MKPIQVSVETILHIPTGVYFEEIQGEAVILRTYPGQYYGLDEVGTRMLQLLRHYHPLQPVCQALLKEFDVSKAQLQKGLLALVETLIAHGLLVVDAA